MSVLALCSASWLIRSFIELPLGSVSSDSDYYDSIPVDINQYFSVGGNYTGDSYKPKINEDGAQALFGCSAAEAEGKYAVDFIKGTYKDEDLGEIEDTGHEGIVAGTHYYKITDKTTGQIISLKHEVVIDKSVYSIRDPEADIKKPDKAVYFSGESLGGRLFVRWTNETTGDTKEYTHHGVAEDFSVAEENSAVTAHTGGMLAGFDQAFAEVTDVSGKLLLRNNYEMTTVDLRYTVLPRCYVEQSGKKTYYSSLAYALDSTRATSTKNTYVVALPSFTYNGETYSSQTSVNGYKNEIDRNCEVGANVTLWIPFDHTTESASNNGKTFIRTAGDGATHTHQKTFGLDADANGSPDYRRNLVTVKAGVTLTNNGKINVSAEVTGGNGGTENAGFVSGQYAELQMKSDGDSISTITSSSGSVINCYGFITKSLATSTSANPKVDMINGSEMITMFTIVEQRGGTVWLNMCGGAGQVALSGAKPTASPFNQFFIQSVSADVNVNYGATLMGHYVLFMNNTNVEGNIPIIGDDSSAFLQLKNDKGLAKITFDNTLMKNVVEVKSDAVVNPIAVDIKMYISATISTQDVFLPISHYWHIEFKDMEKESGEKTQINIPTQKIKVLPGGYIKVGQGVEAIFKSLIVYESATSIPNTSSYLHFIYPQDKGSGTVVVDGTLKAADALGGKIITEKAGAVVSVASASATATELEQNVDSDGVVDAQNTTAVKVTLNAQGNVLASATSTPSNQQFAANTEYTSANYNDNGTNKVVWIKRNIDITYVDVLLDEDGNITDYGDENGTVKSHTVYGDLKPGLSKSGYICEGYYTDKNLTTAADPSTILFATKLYAKWTPAPTYEITYEPNYPSGISGMTFSGGVTDAPAGAFTGVHTVCTTANGTNCNSDTTVAYEFLGWTATQGKETPDTSFEVTEDGLTLYGVWKAKAKVTVTASSNTTVTISGAVNKSYSNVTNEVFYVIKGTELTVSASTTAKSLSFTIDGVSKAGDGTSSSVSHTFSKDTTINASGSCIAAGTLITLADGSVKKVEDLLETDILLVFDHETGEFVEAPIIFIERDGWAEYNVINLKFSDGRVTRLIYEHALFDLTLNKYVYITESNMTEFIGHEFAVGDGGEISTVTLTEAFVTTEYTGCFSLVTAYHLNYFIDGLFSIPGGIEGLFNIFEYGEGLKYDEEKMQADIDKYGLYTYEDFAEYIPEEVYNAFPAAYFKVSIGKGYLTFEQILGYIQDYVVKNGLM